MADNNKKFELQQAIADIETALNAGATSHTSDGQSTTWDQTSLRIRLVELQNQLEGLNGKQSRPLTYTIRLNGGGNE
tara:strand:- start:335 stop:565 length:231 start_codon:yes stop_codon:yes gene_type:complete